MRNRDNKNSKSSKMNKTRDRNLMKTQYEITDKLFEMFILISAI